MSRKLDIDEIVNTASRIRRVRRVVEHKQDSWWRLRRWEEKMWRRHFFWLTLEEGMALTEMLQAWALHEEGEGGGEPAYDAAGHLGDAADCLSSAVERQQMAA
jgi:hypothetical protein